MFSPSKLQMISVLMKLSWPEHLALAWRNVLTLFKQLTKVHETDPTTTTKVTVDKICENCPNWSDWLLFTAWRGCMWSLIMGFWQPVTNLRDYVSQNPPGVTFFLCLLALAISFICLSSYSYTHTLPNPDTTKVRTIMCRLRVHAVCPGLILMCKSHTLLFF